VHLYPFSNVKEFTDHEFNSLVSFLVLPFPTNFTEFLALCNGDDLRIIALAFVVSLGLKFTLLEFCS